jgi:hypothetical protein
MTTRQRNRLKALMPLRTVPNCSDMLSYRTNRVLVDGKMVTQREEERRITAVNAMGLRIGLVVWYNCSTGEVTV